MKVRRTLDKEAKGHHQTHFQLDKMIQQEIAKVLTKCSAIFIIRLNNDTEKNIGAKQRNQKIEKCLQNFVECLIHLNIKHDINDSVHEKHETANETIKKIEAKDLRTG